MIRLRRDVDVHVLVAASTRSGRGSRAAGTYRATCTFCRIADVERLEAEAAGDDQDVAAAHLVELALDRPARCRARARRTRVSRRSAPRAAAGPAVRPPLRSPGCRPVRRRRGVRIASSGIPPCSVTKGIPRSGSLKALCVRDEPGHRVDRLRPRKALPPDERAPCLELQRVPDRRSDALPAWPAL